MFCPVLICPFRRLLKNKRKQNKVKNSLIPLWIPARLEQSGNLIADGDFSPWIDRDYLFAESSTSKQKKEQLLGTTSEEEEYTAKNPAVDVDLKWSSYFEWGINFLKHFASADTFALNINGNEVEHFTFGGEEFILDENAYIALDSGVKSGANESIIQLYNHLIDENESNELLNSFCDLSPGNKRKEISEQRIKQELTSHMGQMKGDNPLADSQRQALHHFSELKDGEILAVNGPPGTGKTTLLQGIVAHLFVEKALANEEPPVILASSANNQAITNIIQSFEGDVHPDILVNRWLPEPVSSFALYCPSNEVLKSDNEEGVLKTSFSGKGFPGEIENQPFLDRAKKVFCEKALQYFSQSFSSVGEIKSHLHTELQKMYKTLEEGEMLLHKQNQFTDEDPASVIENQFQVDKELEVITAKINAADKEVIDISRKLDDLNSVREEWKESYKGLPFYIRWLGTVVPRFRNEIKLHNQFFFKDSYWTPSEENSTSHDKLLAYFFETSQGIFKEKKNADKILSALKEYKELLLKINSWFKQNIKVYNDGENDRDLKLLDSQIRHKMFLYAIHYWEGRWLLEMEDFLKQNKNYSKKDTEKKWLRYAKLTPCFVSTFYMLPKYFSHYADSVNDPLINFADLLIVDEAGQVSPEIGGAGFALARKALVVGDTSQIQPIWGVSKIIGQRKCSKYTQL
ncbi:hypothetical protein DYD21_01395 [Rhodohalobacter sp. SW132]|nr:hypothetical protein DYD21_01395 [Rhodohalobacter sp. SW132]